MPKQPDSFADRLRTLRTAAGLSQSDLASQSGTTPHAISQLETGRRDPRWATICALADALKVSLDRFRSA